MASISLCIVTRNQESNIKEFLESIKELAEEIIFVDTGSIDKTLDIAKEFGCKIFKVQQNEAEWIEEARNLSIKEASKDWILVLDADERISAADFEKIRKLTETKEYLGYYLIQRQYTNKIGTAGWISSKDDKYKESKTASGWYENPIIRLFKNDKRIKYEGKPHDLVDWSVKKIGKTCLTDIPIHHFGEFNREKNTSKADRNIMFLKEHLEDETNKEKFYTLYQIACELIGKGDIKEAKEYLKKSLELNEEYLPSLKNLAGILIKEKNYDEAEKILLKVASKEQDADVYNNLGIIYSERNELNRAVKKFEKALELNEKSADYNFNLGIVYIKMKKESKAIFYFKRAVELNPEYGKRVRFG